MKKSLIVLALLATSFTWAQNENHLHVDLGESGKSLHTLLKKQSRVRTSDPLDPVLAMGQRFYEWLDFINDARSAESQLKLTSPATTRGYPIESPIYNNETLCLQRYEELKTELPDWMAEILFEEAPFISELPISDDEFIPLGLEVDRAYSRASRWILQKPYINSYKARKKSDIRGYYYLNQVPDIEALFTDWNILTPSEQETYRVYLIGMCFNAPFTTESFCQDELHDSESRGQLQSYYNEYFPVAQNKWNSFFLITQYRSDVNWTSDDLSLMTVPFQDPNDQAVRDFLVNNIEEEWSLPDWQLKLDFSSANQTSAYVVFVPGATPNVEGLGGNRITMDANVPLTEYSVQWTIRHEYGHVLGLPDCYVEFFDSRTEEMVSYQLDIENLMCSRRGKLQQIHHDELKRVYFQEI